MQWICSVQLWWASYHISALFHNVFYPSLPFSVTKQRHKHYNYCIHHVVPNQEEFYKHIYEILRFYIHCCSKYWSIDNFCFSVLHNWMMWSEMNTDLLHRISNDIGLWQIFRIQTDESVPICIQQDATLHGLFYLETALHVSGGTSTHHQERIHL